MNVPFKLYLTFSIETRYEYNKLSCCTLTLFLLGSFVSTLVQYVALATLLLPIIHFTDDLLVPILFIVSALIMLIIFFLYPYCFKGCKYKFESIDEGTHKSLKDKIEQETQKIDLPCSQICIMDASKESAHSNAYVSGIGPARKVIIFDTLLGKLEEDEILAVVSHELGHIALYHGLKNALLNIILIAIFVGFFALIH